MHSQIAEEVGTKEYRSENWKLMVDTILKFVRRFKNQFH